MKIADFRIALALIQVLVLAAADPDYCANVEASGDTTCHTCVEITILGGIPDCAYCVSPYRGMTHCQKRFTPPAVPGLGPVYACYNDSGADLPPALRYKPRCAEGDCYINQCLINNAILIWWIVVPTVVGSLLIIVIAVYCCMRRRSREASRRWRIEEEERDKKATAALASRAADRRARRQKDTDALRRKYGLMETDIP